MERLRWQQGQRAAGPKGLRNSQSSDTPWRKKDLGTQRIEDMGPRGRFAPGMRGNGDNGELCGADQLKKDSGKGERGTAQHQGPLRMWGCTGEDTGRGSNEGSIDYLSITGPPSVQSFFASSPGTLPVLNRNILPRKLLGELSPLCTSPAWKHQVNAKCSTDTEQHFPCTAGSLFPHSLTISD